MSSVPATPADSLPMLANPFWHSLLTEHASFSSGGQLAKRYQAGYIPFAGLRETSTAALDQLRDLLQAGESTWVAAPQLLTLSTAWSLIEAITCVQMLYEPDQAAASRRFVSRPEAVALAPQLLTPADVPEMLALKEVAFPGFYGPNAPSLGTYYGFRVNGKLIAMAGERLALPGSREVSAVCTHPQHRGRGYAERLVMAVLELHQRQGLASFLHATAANHQAMRLYERLGFVHTRSLLFHHVRSEAPGA